MLNQEEFLEVSVLMKIMESRRAIYEFLSQVFLQEISQELLQEIFHHNNDLFCTESPIKEKDEFEKGLLLFSRAAKQLKQEKGISEMIRVLGREFVYTFIVKDSHPIYPYESVYLGEKKLLMQKPYDEVRAIFEEAGVKRSEKCLEIEDHVGMELEFMSLLCQKFIDAWKDKKKKEALKFLLLQKNFLSDHLIKWVPQFCEDILKKTRMDFYRGIAYITRGFIIKDHNEIEKIIQIFGVR